MSSPMVQAREWRTRSWPPLRTRLRNARSPACAISFRTWSSAASADRPELAQATVRAAAAQALRLAPGVPLIAGGKSFGGRMTSQAQAAAALPGVRGLAFLGFPLHPAKRPSIERARHLSDVQLPMLFLQGERDALADLELIRSVTKELGARATLRVLGDADHSFHVPARSGRKDSDVRSEMLDALVAWIVSVI